MTSGYSISNASRGATRALASLFLATSIPCGRLLSARVPCNRGRCPAGYRGSSGKRQSKIVDDSPGFDLSSIPARRGAERSCNFAELLVHSDGAIDSGAIQARWHMSSSDGDGWRSELVYDANHVVADAAGKRKEEGSKIDECM